MCKRLEWWAIFVSRVASEWNPGVNWQEEVSWSPVCFKVGVKAFVFFGTEENMTKGQRLGDVEGFVFGSTTDSSLDYIGSSLVLSDGICQILGHVYVSMFALRTVNTGVLHVPGHCRTNIRTTQSKRQGPGRCLDRDRERVNRKSLYQLWPIVCLGDATTPSWRAGDINTVWGRYWNRSRAGTLQIPLTGVCGTNKPARAGDWMALEMCVCV